MAKSDKPKATKKAPATKAPAPKTTRPSKQARAKGNGNPLDDAQIRTRAYLLAERDQFRQPAEAYWHEAEQALRT